MQHVSLEIEGPFAMFTRPDTGSTPISYPMPTYPAAKGIFEAVARFQSAYFHPVCVEICRPVQHERFATNYGGPGRNPANRCSHQVRAEILVDVCYRIHAEVRAKRSARGRGSPQLRRRRGAVDHILRLAQIFEERLRAGQTFYTPCLGWKEFAPSYFGPLRDGTKADPSVNLTIESLLLSMWEHHELKPTFGRDWRIVGGMMSYERRMPTMEAVPC